MSRRAPRLALLTPYWSFFEPSVAHDFRADREELAGRAADVLSRAGDVVARELVDGEAAGAAAGERLAAARPDAVVVLQSMAVPPAFALAALAPLAHVPLVVCAARRRNRVPEAFTHGDITTDGATVGTPQLTNVLHRTGRPHALVHWRPDDPGAEARLLDACTAAAAAGRLRAARIVRVGVPIPGYLSVDCDPEALRAAIGAELLPVTPASVAAAYEAVPADAARAVEDEVRAGFALGPGVEDGGTLAGSARFAAALEALDDRLGADAGVMNCHVAEIRHAPSPGLAPCFALGRETSRGIPWTCSGDVVTVVAMLALKLLGAAALYHEIEALDHETGEALLANTGEHDEAFGASGERPMLVRNRWFDGLDPVCGACACFGPPPGPATLVAFTPHAAEPSGFRFVVAEGTFTGRRFPETGTPNAALRFAGDADVQDAWTAWARAGVNHHSAASPGHHGARIAAVAEHLGVGCTAVTPLST